MRRRTGDSGRGKRVLISSNDKRARRAAEACGAAAGRHDAGRVSIGRAGDERKSGGARRDVGRALRARAIRLWRGRQRLSRRAGAAPEARHAGAGSRRRRGAQRRVACRAGACRRHARPLRPRRRQGAPARGGARRQRQRDAGRRARLGLAARGLRRRRADLSSPRRRRASLPSRPRARGAEARRAADPRSVPPGAARRAGGGRARRPARGATCFTASPTLPPTSPGRTSSNSPKRAPSSKRGRCTSARARSCGAVVRRV